MKRFVAVVLVLCMMLACVPAMADGSMEDCAKTPLAGSTGGRRRNLELAAEKMNGTVLYFGESFSFNDVVGPRTRERGFLLGADAQGRRVLGGGMAQVVTTLYLAVRDCGYIVLDEYHRYGDKFADTYVDDGDDAMQIDYDKDLDFAFTSWYDGMIYINAWIDEDYLYVDLDFYEADDDDWVGESVCASTPLFGSSDKRNNIRLASAQLSWVEVEYGERFSFNDQVGPRSKDVGYRDATNGRGVEAIGGGVAQVATTVYLAAKEMDCISIDPFKTYGDRFADWYVDDPDDAIITDYKAGTDFSFSYWGDGTLVIMVYEIEDELFCEMFEY